MDARAKSSVKGVRMMETNMQAIEVNGFVDENHQLHLEQELTVNGPTRVKVIVLYPLSENGDESEWLSAASQNPAFEYLKESAEDIYSTKDGKPFQDQV
ncbi:MAG: hypothetical protein HY070_09960 [Chloroflexi bacterium]|nr:hypothetical protein [Chloroflexota bacterium]MBI3742360.1 hypothetical protein [Chloroflexota bacterium]